jgi:hypothetical protein
MQNGLPAQFAPAAGTPRQENSVGRWLIRCLFALVLLDGIATFAFSTYSARMFSGHQVPAGQTSVIFYTENARLREGRLKAAASLFEAGEIDRLLTVGGNRPHEGRIGAVDLALTLMARGISDTRLSADESSNDTETSVRAALARRQAAQDFVFISDCMHLVRVREQVRAQAGTSNRHSYLCSHPDRSIGGTWIEAHYELASWGVEAMPDDWQRRFVAWVRP